MTRELEDLGGGDARIGRAAVCVVASAVTGCQSVLHNSAGGLTVQAPRSCYASRDSKGSKGSKLFPLSNFQDEENSTALEDTLTQVFARSWKKLHNCDKSHICCSVSGICELAV